MVPNHAKQNISFFQKSLFCDKFVKSLSKIDKLDIIIPNSNQNSNQKYWKLTNAKNTHLHQVSEKYTLRVWKKNWMSSIWWKPTNLPVMAKCHSENNRLSSFLHHKTIPQQHPILQKYFQRTTLYLRLNLGPPEIPHMSSADFDSPVN